MKKKDIINLIKASNTLNKYKKLSEISKDGKLNEDKWFPDIPELNNEFEVLKKEVKKANKNVEKAKKLQEKSNCNHEVRIYSSSDNMTFWREYECVFCKERITSDNVSNWELDTSRNKHTVTLSNKYDDDGFIDDDEGYTKEEIFKYILDILKNYNDDDEVDLVQEFSKLHLRNCKINMEEKNPDDFILVIGGANSFDINNLYIEAPFSRESIEVFNYFSNLLKTKVKILGNKKLFTSNLFRKSFDENNRFTSYTCYESLEDLENALNSLQKVPFKLVFDLSSLFDIEIKDDNLLKKDIYINLKKYFPNATIIKVESVEDLNLEILKEMLYKENDENYYVYKDNEYYSLNDDKINKDTLENVCKKTKLILKK